MNDATTKPGVKPKTPPTEQEWRDSVERRLHALDMNVSLAVNYCREMAKVHLSSDAIQAIESTLANGTDAEPA